MGKVPCIGYRNFLGRKAFFAMSTLNPTGVPHLQEDAPP